MNLNKVIAQCNKLIDSPYNQLNLNNYFYKVESAYNTILSFLNTPSHTPIKLMSGQHSNSGIIHTPLNKNNKRNIYIVGKGILFDSGGYDIKPAGRFKDMKGDMAGMAIAMAVSSYLKKNVTAFCPVSTNFIHNSQIIPGDIIPIGRKKVEVTNTDAEGRLILAEAISNLNASKNDIIIFIATLTGAVGYAIGKKATGVFTPNNKLARLYAEASEEAKEYAWLLPTWDYLDKKYYRKKLIQNSVKGIMCGASEAALFLKQFVPNSDNWIHLDVAYSAFDEKKRANGVPIRSLINFIKKLQ